MGKAKHWTVERDEIRKRAEENRKKREEEREIAYSDEWEPHSITETREEFDERLSEVHPKIRNYRWRWMHWTAHLSKLSPEERLEELRKGIDHHLTT
jgi:hypothetical protein|tara:strand:+ start:1068 stop:1358 length:291 start_codon:yes stop_codon:yes gene_type:complete